AGPPCAAEPVGGGEPITLVPCASHFEYLQFAPFLDARFRFRFGRLPARDELLDALGRRGGVEQLMLRCEADGYIEGRMPGAGFADAAAVAEMGAQTADTLIIGPSAIQAGLLANLDEASRLVAE